MQPLPALSQHRQRPSRSVAIPSDRVFYDAINQAITHMAISLDQRLTPETGDAIGADDFEAVRSLLECRLEPRFLPCNGRRRMCRGDG
jgi:hypothetical protein